MLTIDALFMLMINSFMRQGDVPTARVTKYGLKYNNWLANLFNLLKRMQSHSF